MSKRRKEETTQTAEINRVKKKIGDLILEFYHERILIGQCGFQMNELENYINTQTPITAGSAGRILRNLRQCGRIDYEVVKRSESLYKLVRLPGQQLHLGV